jgi:hypothetical protein
MQRILTAIGSALVCSAAVWAAPPACVTGTLASYIALGANGCTLAGTVYANVSYSATASGGAAKITPQQIAVIPQFEVPATGTFSFSAAWKVDQGQLQDTVITYTAVPPCGRTGREELRLALGTAHIGGIIGLVDVSETTNVGNLDVNEHCAEICEFKGSDSRDFNAVSVVLMTHHVHLGGGSEGASLNEFRATLDTCPLCL